MKEQLDVPTAGFVTEGQLRERAIVSVFAWASCCTAKQSLMGEQLYDDTAVLVSG